MTPRIPSTTLLRRICRRRLLAVAVAVFIASSSAYSAAPLNTIQRTNGYTQKLDAARTAYFQVLTTGSRDADHAAHQALSDLEHAFPGDPTAEVYHGSLELLDAAHDWQIWNLHRQATDGLLRLDHAVAAAPDDAEIRFMRAATSWHLPAFYHRRPQCESDFAWLSGRAVASARQGTLPPELAAASMNYWGRILVRRGQSDRARTAFQQAIQIAPQSPGAQDAARRLRSLQ